MRVVTAIAFIFLTLTVCGQNRHTISGYLTDKSNGEVLIGASVFDSKSKKGVISNTYGFFSLTLPEDSVALSVSYIGFKKQVQKFYLNKSTDLNFTLSPSTKNLQNVVISAEKYITKEEVQSTQMSVIRLRAKEIEKIPAIGGEVDLIKVAQLLPGISRGGEGATGMYVRGGTDDQNLVLLDGATVYNIGHLFGFFSVFNNDAIRDMTIIKGGFPAQYGGRLSSVLDVRMKEGDLQKWHGAGGIGLLSSRLTFSGPIIKDKLAIMVSGRRTYIDQVLKLTGANLPYFFYDLNAKLSYKISRKDRLFFSTYVGDDVLDFNETVGEGAGAENVNDIGNELNFGFNLGNITSTLRWNHIYNQDKLFSNITLFQTSFDYDIRGAFLGNNLLIRSSIRDIGMKATWDYFPNPDNNIKFGIHTIAHFFRPNVINTSGDISEALESEEGEKINNQEFAIFANNDQKINDKISLNYGLRISSSSVPNKFYAGIEPRFGMKYSLGETMSAKMNYTYMKQYVHRVSSSSVALPTDLWYPVTENIKPQSSHQIALGLFKGFESLNLNVSLEGFFKTMNNLIEYREGARLLLNDNFEEELLNGKGIAFGLELLVRKRLGKFTGWIGYSLASTNRTFEGLNNGEAYSAKYDRRHDISLVMTFDINPRFSFSSVWVLSSGARFTAQNGQYFMPNVSFTGVQLIPIYTKRNAVELSPSHRLDFNFILKNKSEKKFRSEWHFGAYNFYNRASPYQVRVDFDGLNYRYVQPGLFGFIPSVAWNFKF